MSYFEEILNKYKQQHPQVDRATHSKLLDEVPLIQEPLVKRQMAKEPMVQEQIKPSPVEDRLGSQEIAGTHNQLNHNDAIFRIFAPQTVGSGFFYAPAGEFMTDLHVVGKANVVKIVLNDGRKLTAVVDKRDRANDLAAGHIVEPKTEFPYLIFGNPKSLEGYKGDTYAAGYAYGRDFKLLPGQFRKMSYAGVAADGDLEPGEDSGRPVGLFNTFTPPAMSGGVIFTKDFLPIGVISKGDINDKGPSSTTISTPISECVKLMRQPRTYKLDARL